MRDLGIIGLSIVIAVFIVKTDFVANILTASREWELLGSFLAGIFFTSVFTAAPATIILAEAAQANSIFLVALFGGLGALLGDWIIFRFVENRLSGDILYLIKKVSFEKRAIFKLRIFSWFIPLLGALIIASPLPDEIGIALMGFAKVKAPVFILISFAFNTLGILIIGLIARGVF